MTARAPQPMPKEYERLFRGGRRKTISGTTDQRAKRATTSEAPAILGNVMTARLSS